MSLSKKLLVLCLAVIAAVGFCACGGKQGAGNAAGKKVIFAAHSEASGFTGKLYDGISSKLQSIGAEVEFLDGKGDANLQIDQLNEAISQKPAAIILLAVDGTAVIPTVEKANEAGIPIIATNRDLNGGKFVSVMSDERQAGRLQGEYMARHLPQGARLVYLMGESSQSGAIQRWEGFKEACLDKRPDVQLLARADGNWSTAEGLKNMTLWLKLFPQINAVAAGNDDMALGAVKALKAANRMDGVLVSGVDATDDAIKAIEAGDMSQTVKQDAGRSVDEIFTLMQAFLNGDKPTENVVVPFIESTKDNVAQFKQ